MTKTLTILFHHRDRAKIEKEKREHARQHGMIRTEFSGGEIAEEMEKERRMYQLQMCEVRSSFSFRFTRTSTRSRELVFNWNWLDNPQIKGAGSRLWLPVSGWWFISAYCHLLLLCSICWKSTRSSWRKVWTSCRTSSSISTLSASTSLCRQSRTQIDIPRYTIP